MCVCVWVRESAHAHLLSGSRSPPLQGGLQCVSAGYGWHPGPQSWAQGGWAETLILLWKWPCLSPGPASAPSHTEPDKWWNQPNMKPGAGLSSNLGSKKNCLVQRSQHFKNMTCSTRPQPLYMGLMLFQLTYWSPYRHQYEFETGS